MNKLVLNKDEKANINAVYNYIKNIDIKTKISNKEKRKTTLKIIKSIHISSQINSVNNTFLLKMKDNFLALVKKYKKTSYERFTYQIYIYLYKYILDESNVSEQKLFSSYYKDVFYNLEASSFIDYLNILCIQIYHYLAYANINDNIYIEKYKFNLRQKNSIFLNKSSIVICYDILEKEMQRKTDINLLLYNFLKQIDDYYHIASDKNRIYFFNIFLQENNTLYMYYKNYYNEIINDEQMKTLDASYSKKKKKYNDKRRKKISLLIYLILFIIILVLAYFTLMYFVFIVKDEVSVEIKSEKINSDSFVFSKIINGSYEIDNDLNSIDLNTLGEYDIIVKVRNKKYKSKLKIVDTVKPEIETKDVELGLNGEYKVEDFIVEGKDNTNITYELKEKVSTNKYGEYKVVVIAKDEGNNVTEKECNLYVRKVRSNVDIQFNDKLTIDKIVYNYDEKDQYEFVNYKENTTYNYPNTIDLELIVNDEKYNVTVNFKDTEKPIVTTKNMTIWLGETLPNENEFITNIVDQSEYKIIKLTNIDYQKLGAQEISFEVEDIYNNKTTCTAVLEIIDDTTGPTFYGLSTITIDKGTSINYRSGVSAVDNKDGEVTWTVNTSSVNTSVAGTYYAVYQATDKKGNITSNTRRIIVNSDWNDIYAKVDQILPSIINGGMSQSQKAYNICQWVRSNISYSTVTTRSYFGGASQGLNTLRGDCYVHWAVTTAFLERAGIQTKMIFPTNYSHYWNLVYVDGHWRHLDSTPFGRFNCSLMTDDEKYTEMNAVYPRDWVHSDYPAAN